MNKHIIVTPRQVAFSKTLQKCHEVIMQNEHISSLDAFHELCKILYIKIIRGQKVKTAFEYTTTWYDCYNDIYPNDAFHDSRNISLSESTISQIFSYLSEYSLHEMDKDFSGYAVETLMNRVFRAGNGGLYTSSKALHYAVEILAPQPYETIIDPCCGTANFAIQANAYCKQSNIALSECQITSVDVNPIMYLTSLVNLTTHNLDVKRLRCEDILQPDSVKSKQRYDVVFIDPPHIDKDFDVEARFLSCGLELLKPNGRLGIFLPSSFLGSDYSASIRCKAEDISQICLISILTKDLFRLVGIKEDMSFVVLKRKTESSKDDYTIPTMNIQSVDDLSSATDEFVEYREKHKLW